MEDNIRAIAQSKHQLAESYNISLYTLSRWIEPIKEVVGRYRGKVYTPNQVKIIYEHLGHP